jgi:hypothetical protein
MDNVSLVPVCHELVNPFVVYALLTSVSFPKKLMLGCAVIMTFSCNCVPHLQGTRTGSDAWPISYEIAGSSSAGKSSSVAAERRAPSAGELSLI